MTSVLSAFVQLTMCGERFLYPQVLLGQDGPKNAYATQWDEALTGRPCATDAIAVGLSGKLGQGHEIKIRNREGEAGSVAIGASVFRCLCVRRDHFGSMVRQAPCPPRRLCSKTSREAAAGRPPRRDSSIATVAAPTSPSRVLHSAPATTCRCVSHKRCLRVNSVSLRDLWPADRVCGRNALRAAHCGAAFERGRQLRRSHRPRH